MQKLAHATVAAIMAATLSTTTHAQQPQARPEDPPATPAPAPGSAGIFKSDDQLTPELKNAIARMTGDTGAARIANTDQYRVNLVHRDKAGAAISHRGWTELHYIVEGTGTIVTGGTIVRPPEGSNARTTVNGGETHQVKKGDVVIVPAGSAHWYKEVNGGITYLEVRFVAPPAK